MISTPNLGLAVWNNELDGYSSSQLAGNWDLVDNHDHTLGRGKPITTGALADGAVTAVKLGAQDAWSSLTLTGSWGSALRYFKDSLGMVHVRSDSIVGPSAGVTGSATIGTFPAGYRPVSTQYFSVVNTTSGAGLLAISVASTGVITWGSSALAASTPVAFLMRFRGEN